MKRFLRVPRVMARRPGAVLTAVVLLAGGIALVVTRPAPPAAGPDRTTASRMSPQFRAELDALRQAMTTRAKVTVGSLTTGLSETVANPNGTLTRTDYAEPVRVRRDGGWQPVNADLKRAPDGSWQPEAVPSGVSLSGGGSGPLAVLTSAAGQRMSLSFPAPLPAPVIAGDTATYRSVWPGTDLRVTVSTLGGISWTLVVRNAAAAANPALRHLNLGVSTGDLTAGSDQSGNLTATGPDGAARFSGPSPAMWDSAPGPALTGRGAHAGPRDSTSAGPGRGAHMARVPSRIAGHSLSLTPGSSLLSKTARYPVYLSSGITPDITEDDTAGGSTSGGGTTLSAGPAVGTVSLAAAAATPTPNPSLNCGTIENQNEACSGSNNGFVEVQQGCPTATNYNVTQNPGSYAGNGIGYNWWNSCTGVYRSYYQFDTSGLINDASGAPSGGQLWVQSATLYAWVKYSADWTCTDTWPVYLDWTGPINSGTDWSNKPGNDANDQRKSTTTPPGPNANSSCNGQVVNFDVAYAMADAVSSGAQNMTFGLSGNETASSSSSNIGFMRIGNNPDIVTVFDINPPAPTPETTVPDSHYEPGGPVNYGCNAATNNLPWLGAVDSTVDYVTGNPFSLLTLQAGIKASITGEQVRAAYTMWEDGNTIISPGGNAVWSDWYTSSGTTSTYPGYLLKDGHRYTWTTQAYVTGIPTGSTPGYWSHPAAAVCGFNYDATSPTVPTVTSTDFPASGSGGAAKASHSSGTFHLSATDLSPCSGCLVSGVYEYLYSLNSASFPSPAKSSSSGCGGTCGVILAAASNPTDLTLTVGDWGTNILYVEAVDQAGNISLPFHYYFYVPWNPNVPVVPGDVNGDGIPDLLSTDTGGDLTLYQGKADPAISPHTASVPADSPDHTSWSGYQIAHRGPLSQVSASGDVDDLFARKGSNLYLYENNPKSTGTGPQFEDTGAIIQLQRPACSGSGCSGYASDWSGVTQMLAPGDAWNPTPLTSGTASPPDTGQPSLLTVENGALWLFQGGYGPGLQDPVELGSSGWNNVTLLAPGLVGGQLTIWAYENSSGKLYSYPVYLAAGGVPSLTSGSTAPRTATSGTVVFTNPHPENSPVVATPGSLTDASNNKDPNLAYPGLFIATQPGSGSSYPNGTLPNDIMAAGSWTAPSTLGGAADAAGGTCPNGCLWYYPGQSTAGGASPLQSTPVFVGDLYAKLTQLS